MEQLPLTWKELLEVVVFFSSLTLFTGIIIQFLMLYLQDRLLSIKILLVVAVTQIIVLIATILIALKWPMGIKEMYGPLYFPAAIAEVVLIPLVSSFFNYGISFRKRK
jgi:hypothetical protein